MSQSPLVDYEAYTTVNCNAPRNQKISKITVHHAAGVMSVEGMKNIIHNPNREVSCNYAIGWDARVGGYIKEENRSWCSSSYWNDQRAVTIEVSNSACSSDWPVSDKVWSKLVDLCVDICKRNGIPKLTYTGDQNGSLTFHSFYTSTCCPGPYIKSRAQLLCDQVNAKLNGAQAPTVKPTDPKTDPTVPVSVKVGDLVSINSGAVYWSGTSIPSWVKNLKWKISDMKNNRAILGQSEDGKYNIQSPIDVKYLTKINTTPVGTETSCNEQIKLPAGTPIYYNDCKSIAARVKITGTYTLIAKKVINGKLFGKLKSGAGWISLEKFIFNKGDLVSLASDSVYYNNSSIPSWVKKQKWYIDSISGDKAILGRNESGANNIQSPINTLYLIK